MKVTQQKFDKIGTRMANAGKTMSLAMTAPLAAFGVAAGKAAIDAEEMESAFAVTFGKSAGSVRQWAEETGDAMGRSTQELMEMSMNFQDILKKQMDAGAASELSKDLTVLTQDLASFKNLSNDVAKQKIFSGLIGESEPLRAVGVTLSAAKVEAKALEMGLEKVNGQFTESAKIQARAAVIQEELADASGDVIRTQDSTANRIRAAQAAWEELSVTIGQKLIPAITPLIEKVADALNWFSSLNPQVQRFAVLGAGIAAALGPVLYVVGNLTSAFGILLPLLIKLGPAFAVVRTAALALMTSPPILAFAAVVLGIYLAWKNWDKIKPYIDAVGKAVSDFWNGKVKPALDAVGSAIMGTIRFFLNLRQNATQAIIQMGAAIFAKLQDIAGRMLAIGRDIIAGLVNGIKRNASLVWQALKDVVMSGIKNVKSFLGIQSPSRVFMEIGGFVTEGFAIGIERTKRANEAMLGMVTEAFDTAEGVVKERMGRLQSLISELFPEIGAAKEYRQFQDDLANSGLSQAEQDRIRQRYARQQTGADLIDPYAISGAVGPMSVDIEKAMARVEATMGGIGGKVQVQTVRIAESFKDMADKALGALRGLADGIKKGDFFSILEGAIGLFTQLGSMGVFGKGIQTNLNKTPAYANGTNFHPGGLALVGERGPELVSMARGSSVLNAQATKGALGGGRMQVAVTVENGNLRAFVRNESGQLIAQSAPGIMAGGAQMAGNDLTWQQSRRLG